jgi:hypothetical protein
MIVVDENLHMLTSGRIEYYESDRQIRIMPWLEFR